MNRFFIQIRFIIIISVLGVLLLSSSCRTRKELTTSEKAIKKPALTLKYAKLLNVDEGKIENIKLYTFINDWYGVKYKYGGKTKKGVDCSGFTSQLYRDVYEIPLNGTASSIFYQCQPIIKGNLKEGDLLFFKIENENVNHIGVYLQNNKFVHASVKKGVMIDDLNEPYYKKYFYKAGKIELK